MREFLKYVVEHTITGPSGTLKERSIGVELFQLREISIRVGTRSSA